MELLKFFIKDEVPAVGLTRFGTKELNMKIMHRPNWTSSVRFLNPIIATIFSYCNIS